MNFAQITDIERQGLIIETQMTYEERNQDQTLTVFRLLRVSIPKLLEIQRTHAGKLEQQHNDVEKLLQRLQERASRVHGVQHGQSLTDQLKATERVMVEREQEMAEVSRRARARLDGEREAMKKKCLLLVIRMTREEVNAILGPVEKDHGPTPHSIIMGGYQHFYQGHYHIALKYNAGGRLESWLDMGYRPWKVGFCDGSGY